MIVLQIHVLFVNIVGCFNCAYLGFYGRDSFTSFDLFAHLVILSMNQYCNSWGLYCAYVMDGSVYKSRMHKLFTMVLLQCQYKKIMKNDMYTTFL